ncbi:MAG: ATP-binding cassette domain-containing protein [Bacteriovoracaceae bacterium]|nr:ATP-binding cassette domain-containing protein [Bacteriovoracaceae bacterium]
MALLEVKNLKVYFPVRENSFFKRKERYVQAVDDVSFEVEEGEVLGIVGESGCGKSTLVRALMRLIPTTAGAINLLGEDLLHLPKNKLRLFRKNFQMIFQDPESSLNPRFTVGEIIGEPLKIFESNLSHKEHLYKVQDLMEKVGLSSYMIRRYPHEFSGGQRQRICIARALSIHPKLIICDEAVSALDVSIQAQILNLLNEIKERFKLTYIFISHDLAVTRHISDRIIVMYLGKIVETGRALEIIKNPQHPYTKALLASVPEYKKERNLNLLTGDIPSPINPPKGCRFHTRCPLVEPKCLEIEPILQQKSCGNYVACHLV